MNSRKILPTLRLLRKRAMFIYIAATTLICYASGFSVTLQEVNHRLVDISVGFTEFHNRPIEVLLIVDDPSDPLTVPEWQTLTRSLLAYQPVGIGLSGFATLPLGIEDPSLIEDPANVATQLEEAEPVARHYPFTVTNLNKSETSFAVRLAQRLSTSRLEASSPAFLVQFNKERRMPHLMARQALDGHLIQELISGKLILIGRSNSSASERLLTPIGPVSRLEYHGYAADTLLSRYTITRASSIATILLLAVVSSALLIYPRVSSIGIINLSLVSILITLPLAIGWNLLAYTEFPFGQLMLMILGTAGLSHRDRLEDEQRIIRQMITDYGKRLDERLPTRNFEESPEHWEQILNLVNQTLELKRVLFLERDASEHRVREIIAQMCSLEDIQESRRDYDREPYRTAITTRSPLKLDQPYLTALENDEQYLVALSFAGEVVGFWAFSIESDTSADRRLFIDAVTNFSEQIAEMLFLRNSYQRSAAALIKTDNSVSPAQRLREVMTSSEKRLVMFEDVFASQSSATIVYDLFGQVVQMNLAMNTLLTDLEFTAHSGTALDFLVKATGQSAVYCRGLLRYIVLGGQQITIPANFSAPESPVKNQSYQLTIGPVGTTESNSESSPFRMTGILLEIQDISSLQQTSSLKQDIIERLGFRLRGDSESLILAGSLLADETLEADMRAEVTDVLIDKAGSIARIVDQVRDHLATTETSESKAAYPVDSMELLDRALVNCEEVTSSKRIEVTIKRPHVASSVLAQAAELQEIWEAIITLMVQDASATTQLRISVTESDEDQYVHFANTGFGIPMDRFQHYMNDINSAASHEFEKLRIGKKRLSLWQGTMGSESQIGVGFKFTITMQRVI